MLVIGHFSTRSSLVKVNFRNETFCMVRSVSGSH